MYRQNSRFLVSSALLLLLVAQGCQAELMCYVCSDCAQVNAQTQLQACNEDFFNTEGSTEASTVTTTTTTTTEATTTTEPSTTTEALSTTTDETTTLSTTSETTPVSTDPPMPTPETVGPVETTSPVPTPPVTPTLRLFETNNDTQIRLFPRQRRAAIENDFTYHCYTVEKTVNETMTTERGCSRVATNQGVCELLKEQNANVQLSHCDPCSMNRCNGSAALQVSLLSLLLVAIAGILQWK